VFVDQAVKSRGAALAGACMQWAEFAGLGAGFARSGL
jgi:hypothetical protein